jgi:hypothetical protein
MWPLLSSPFYDAFVFFLTGVRLQGCLNKPFDIDTLITGFLLPVFPNTASLSGVSLTLCPARHRCWWLRHAWDIPVPNDLLSVSALLHRTPHPACASGT